MLTTLLYAHHAHLAPCTASRPVCIPGVSRFMPDCTTFEEWFKDVGTLHSNLHYVRYSVPTSLPRLRLPRSRG